MLSLVFFGCGEDEFGVCRGLFEGFEEGVEGACREHMNLVDDVDFVAAGLGREVYLLDQFADVVDGVVRCCVELENVERCSRVERAATFAFVAGLVVGGEVGAVYCFGQYAGAGGFAHSAWPAEEESLGQLPGADGVFEGCGDMALPHHTAECLGPIFSCRYYVVVHFVKYNSQCKITKKIGLGKKNIALRKKCQKKIGGY